MSGSDKLTLQFKNHKKMNANLELEKTLWKAADKLRNNMDAAEYKHVVLGLIFLKYISDAFNELYEHLKACFIETDADPEDKDEYTAERDFHVQPSASWKWLHGRAKLPTINKDIDDAMDAIEKDNLPLQQMQKANELNEAIKLNLAKIGYEL
jgi:type I restriction enzyme M protein